MQNASLAMALKLILIVVLLYSVSLGCNGVTRPTYRNDDLDLEKDLQFPKKQFITSIHTRPSYMAKRLKDDAKNPLRVGLKGEGCPTGTVPIMRSDETNIIKSGLFSKTDISNINPLGANEPGHHYAIVRTKSNPSKKFLGAESYFSLHNPQVSGSQFSASQMKLSNGLDSIQAGWMVSMDLFKDNLTHLFAHFTAGATQCFNLQCPGFVQVSSKIHLGDYSSDISVVGGQAYVWKLAIAKDPKDGNWWLYFGEDKIRVGYWPKILFTGLANFASQVQWGGEVFAPQGQAPPKMGTGLLPVILDTSYAAYCSRITIVDESLHYVNAHDTETYTDGKFPYSIIDVGYWGSHFGHIILFGGTG